MDDKNVFELLSGGKQQLADDDKLPETDYCLTLHDRTQVFGHGFMIFTTNHVAIMSDTGAGSIPVAMVPLSNLAYAQTCDDEDYDEEEAPF